MLAANQWSSELASRLRSTFLVAFYGTLRYLRAQSPALCLSAGQERFGNMTRVYYRDALGAFVVFDVTRSCTFEAVRKWKEDLDDKVSASGGKRVAAVLLANKCDQDRDDTFAKNYGRMEQFCREHGFISWFETSAKVPSLNAGETTWSWVVQSVVIVTACNLELQPVLTCVHY